MNQLQIFKNSEFGEIRTVTIDDEPWFVAIDVCRSLELLNPTAVISRLDEDERAKFNLGRQGETNVVNEYGLYNLVLGSRKPEAKQFKRWITHEVIPQIRKTGSYIPDASALSPELQLMNALVAQMNQEALSRMRLESEMKETREEIHEIREVVELKPFDNWREDTNSLINKICKKTGDYKDTRHRIYDALNQRARVDIKRRLDNMKARAIVAGMQRSKADNLTYLDVIAEDKKLIEIYTAIVKEMAIKKGVN